VNPEPLQPDEEDPRRGPEEQPPAQSPADRPQSWLSPSGRPADTPAPRDPGYGQTGPPPGYRPPGYEQPAPQPGYRPPGYEQPAPQPGYRPTGPQPGYDGQADTQPGYGKASPLPGYGQPGPQPRYGQPGAQPAHRGRGRHQGGFDPAGTQAVRGPAASPPAYGQPGSPAGYSPPGGPPGYSPAGTQAPYPYAAAPPGYPGGQNPTMAFPGGPPPASGKRRRGLLIGIAAAVVVIVVAAVSLTLALGGGDSPTTMALKSGQAIGAADGIAYTGTLAGNPADLSVTRAGTVEGTYTDLTRPVSRVTVRGVTYLNAPTAFWTGQGIGPAEAGQAGGHWAKAPADAVSLSFDSLTPVQIAHVLEHVGPNPDSVTRTFDGKKIIVVTDGGVSYYITASEPHLLIHVAGGSGVDAYSFDVRPLTAATVKPVFTSLHSYVQALVGAADPSAIVDGGTPEFLDCNGATRCSVSSSVTVTDPTAQGNFSTPPVLVKMTIGFAPSQNGKPFANCSTTVGVPSAAAVKPACGVTGGAWTAWFNSHSGHFNVWAEAAYRVTVNSASSVATLQTALSQEQGGS
jgi:hypothetical protein